LGGCLLGDVRSEREEKLLEDVIEKLRLIKDVDGIKKIQDAITAVISSGTVNVQQSNSDLLRALSRSWGLNVAGLVNPDFEDGLEGWTIDAGSPEIVTSPVFKGKKALKLLANEAVSQRINPPIPTDDIMLAPVSTVFTYADVTGQYLEVNLFHSDGSTRQVFLYHYLAGVWEVSTLAFDTGKNLIYIQLKGKATNTDPIYIDTLNLHHKKVVELRDNAARALGTVSFGTPRAPLLISGALVNPDFEHYVDATTPLPGWIVSGTAFSQTAYVASGYRAARIYYNSWILQPLDKRIPVNDLLMQTIMVSRRELYSFLRITYYYDDGTTSTQDYTPPNLYLWYQLTLTPTAGRILTAIKFANASTNALAIHLYLDAICLVEKTSITGVIDVSDKWTRQLGQIDIARYLGSPIGLTNPLHSQIVYGGAVIDPRTIPLKGTPQRYFSTASGEVQATPGVGSKLQVYGFYLAAEADEILRLRYGGVTGTIFFVLPSKGVASMNLVNVNEAGAADQNIYLEKTGAGNALAVVWTETVGV